MAATPISAVQADMLDEILDASIITGWRGSDGNHMAGVKFDLAPGWKTYWRQPGDVGIPPQFDWSQSKNLTGASVVWPVPDVTYDQGMRTIGYDGTVILPIVLRPDHSGPIQLVADVEIGVCEEICIPVSLKLSATLPAKGAYDADLALATSLRTKPGVGKMTCRFDPADDGMKVTLVMPKPRHGADAGVVEINLPGAWIGEPVLKTDGDVVTMTSEIVTPSGKMIAIDRSDVIATIFAGEHGSEFIGCTGG
ncbi:MAG: protein-disulfide reductase DsbD domain-containing protein [Planktomarina sp.]